jgi:hypothetical protein
MTDLPHRLANRGFFIRPASSRSAGLRRGAVSIAKSGEGGIRTAVGLTTDRLRYARFELFSSELELETGHREVQRKQARNRSLTNPWQIFAAKCVVTVAIAYDRINSRRIAP